MVKKTPNNLRALRKSRGLTLKQVAALTGISLSGVQKHETGERDMDTEILELYEQFYKVTKNQIAPSAFDKKLSSAPFMPGSMRENEPSLQEGFGYYPIHELDTIAGASQEHLHKYKKLEPPFPIPTANLQETSYSDIKNLYIIRIFGDGMEPTLSDGNRVVIDTGITKPDKPGIYALWNDTGLTIKRLQSLSNGMVQLVADNKNYPLETAALKDLKIKGRIILIVSQMV